MKWKCFLTIFRAEAPVHIGYKQIGILKTTRYYITGRAMWGAITASLTRDLFENPDSKDYQAVGNFVRENIRTTYFYPAINKNEVNNREKWDKCDVNNYLVFLPEYTQKGIKFGEKTKEEFEQMFIGSFVSTALESQTRSTEEGSLHEIEYIKNRVGMNGKCIQVHWVGYIFINIDAHEAIANSRKYDVKLNERNDDIEIEFRDDRGRTYRATLKDCLNVLLVGGERNYGFGRLKLEKIQENNNGKIFGKFNFRLEDKVIFKDLDIAISHVKIDKNNKIKLKAGEVEPVVGLEWSNKGAGQSVSEARICITPGSKLKQCNLVLCNCGVLKL